MRSLPTVECVADVSRLITEPKSRLYRGRHRPSDDEVIYRIVTILRSERHPLTTDDAVLSLLVLQLTTSIEAAILHGCTLELDSKLRLAPPIRHVTHEFIGIVFEHFDEANNAQQSVGDFVNSIADIMTHSRIRVPANRQILFEAVMDVLDALTKICDVRLKNYGSNVMV